MKLKAQNVVTKSAEIEKEQVVWEILEMKNVI